MTTRVKIAMLGLALLSFAAMFAAVSQFREAARLREQLAKAAVSRPGAVANPRLAPSLGAEFPAPPPVPPGGAQSRLQKIRELGNYVSRLGPHQLGGALEALNQTPQDGYGALLRELLLARWTDDNPAAALAWAKAQTNPAQRAADMRSVLEAWADQDLAAAAGAISQVDDGPARNEVAKSLFFRLAQHDAPAALEALSRLPIGQRTPELYGAVFSAWGAQDPQAAAAAALALPPSKGQNEALTLLARAWAGRDPAAALTWADSLPAGDARTGAVAALLDVMAKQDPKAAVSYFGALAKSADRYALASTIAASWATQDPASALAWAQSTATGQLGDRAVRSVLAQMQQADPAAAAKVLAAISEASVRDEAVPQLAAAWAQTDIQSALKWVEELPEGDGVARAAAFQNVLRAWAETDPVTAAAYAGSHTDNPNFRAIADEIARNWAAADPRATITWLESLPGGGPTDNALRTALTVYAETDPQAAWNYVMEKVPAEDPSGIRAKIMANIIGAWSGQNPAQAAEAIGTLPSNLQNAATATVASNWLKEDPLGASQWITSLPPSGTRDTAVAQLISVEGRNDPALAFDWALSMRNSNLRNTSLDAVMRQWAQRTPASAEVRALVQAAELPEAQRAALLETYRKYSSQWGRMQAQPVNR